MGKSHTCFQTKTAQNYFEVAHSLLAYMWKYPPVCPSKAAFLLNIILVSHGQSVSILIRKAISSSEALCAL